MISTTASQTPMMHAGNISLQGFTVQQLNEWLEKTYTSQKTTVTAVEPEKIGKDEYLNFVRLGVEAAELVDGTMGVKRLELYTEAELRYLCPKITKEVGKVHGGANRPVAYFSATLDPVAAALPGCLCAVAAVGQSLTQCEGIVMGSALTVMVPHSVEILLTRTKTQHMTNARLTKYETIILGSPNVSLKRCTVLNPATLLPAENTEVNNEEEVEHDCLEVTELCTKPRPDIQDTQLKENDCIMFVDGSCLRDSIGTPRAGYAVCTIAGIIEASWLEKVYSAQVAELIALTKACHAAENLRVTIYTDSRYGFGIVHDFGQLWSQRGFMTSSGSPMKNVEQIKDLLHAIQLPLEIAVVKCNAHVKSQDFGGYSNFGGVLIRPKSDGKVTDIPPAVLRVP
ncbi:hypothetical protein NDU88_003966 [Pleurodeles waltl]|uniref:RNase H type-1 domain-containing protein n=1 Tax=Pleurodeles waltl TaxID=8319 RepID=A0AAV7T6W8_PLEWA|nr:hypothetical protein NDU88_003966 [Pleurodeles waltl]